MQILLNGEATHVDDDSSVADLVATLDGHRGTAVAVNGAVVPRARHLVTVLRDGDAVEIVRAVQGG